MILIFENEVELLDKNKILDGENYIIDIKNINYLSFALLHVKMYINDVLIIKKIDDILKLLDIGMIPALDQTYYEDLKNNEIRIKSAELKKMEIIKEKSRLA